MNDYSYRINPRATELGGGWRLRLLRDGTEVGGGVFPPTDDPDPETALREAFSDAQSEAEAWLQSRERK